MKRIAVLFIIITFLPVLAGCTNKTAIATNQNIKTLVEGFQQNMITYFDIKNMQDTSTLPTQINDSLRKIEDSKTKLEQLSGLKESVTDLKIKAELTTLIDLQKQRISLSLKYLDDIRKDYDYRSNNPDTQVNINTYIFNIPATLMDLEYQAQQSIIRLNKLLVLK